MAWTFLRLLKHKNAIHYCPDFEFKLEIFFIFASHNVRRKSKFLSKKEIETLKAIFDSPLSEVEFCGLAVSNSLDFDKGRVLVLITESTSVSGENTLSVQAAHG